MTRETRQVIKFRERNGFSYKTYMLVRSGEKIGRHVSLKSLADIFSRGTYDLVINDSIKEEIWGYCKERQERQNNYFNNERERFKNYLSLETA